MMTPHRFFSAAARTLFAVTALGIAVAGARAAAMMQEPWWAWGFNTAPSTDVSSAPPPAPRPATTILLHVEGSKASFTRAQVIDSYGPADWFPDDHPPMPDIVAHGRKTAAPPIT